MMPLHTELLSAQLPRAVYYDPVSESYRLWNTATGVAPTYILWSITETEAGLTGSVTAITTGEVFGPVPSETKVVLIEFDPGVCGTFNSEFITSGTEDVQGITALNGVYTCARVVVMSPEQLVFHKVYGTSIADKQVRIHAEGGKIRLYNPGVVINPMTDAMLEDPEGYLITDSEGNIIMGITDDSGSAFFSLTGINGTVLQAAVSAEEFPYYIQDDGTIKATLTARHIADGQPDGRWEVAAGTEAPFEGFMPVDELALLSDMPFAAVISGGVLTPWNSGTTGEPSFIVYDIEEASMTGSVVSITAGLLFGPVPERELTADIAFTAVDPGMYGAMAVSNAVGWGNAETELLGYVYTTRLSPRLDSMSRYRFGVYSLPFAVIPSTPVTYYTDNDRTVREYNGQAVLNDGASIIFFVTEGYVFYTYALTSDPMPYWNSQTVLPPIILNGAGILDPSEQEWLLVPYPEFKYTGDTEYHALLSIHELGVEEGLIQTALVERSWRMRSRNTLMDTPFFIKDPVQRYALDQMTAEERYSYIIAMLCAKLGWTEV